MGKKILDHPINPLWRSPYKHFLWIIFLVTPFTLLTLLPHLSTLYVEFTPYTPWFIFPLTTIGGENRRTVEAVRPHPQTTTVAHFIKVCCICFIKIRKSKNNSFVYCLRQGWKLFPCTMNSTFRSLWNKVGGFACSWREISTTYCIYMCIVLNEKWNLILIFMQLFLLVVSEHYSS